MKVGTNHEAAATKNGILNPKKKKSFLLNADRKWLKINFVKNFQISERNVSESLKQEF